MSQHLSPMYSVFEIAYWFIERNEQAMAEKGADPMSLLRLLKLLYYAEGCYLALHYEQKLFGEKIVAREHGPAIEEVIERVYDAYLDPYNLVLTDQERKAAHRIAQEDQEIEKTRSELPWLEATQNGQCVNREINQQTCQRETLYMPISSIFENIIISDPEKAEKFINALNNGQ